LYRYFVSQSSEFCAASQREFVVVSVHFVIDSVWKLLDTPPYVVVSKRFWTNRLERELQIVQLSVTRYSCIAIS
jgi:hypothetical protein